MAPKPASLIGATTVVDPGRRTAVRLRGGALGGDLRRDTMTTVSKFEDFLDELDRLIETKENPDEWYVVSGKHVGEYSIQAAEQPEEYNEMQDELPPEERDATENVDGFYQIGTLGWSEQAFATT